MKIVNDLLENRKRLNYFVGLLLLGAGAVSLLALASYHGGDRPFFFTHTAAAAQTQNWFGRIGATLGEAWLQTFGAAAFLAAIFLAAFGWSRVRAWERPVWGRALGYAAIVISLAALLELLFGGITLRGSDRFGAGGFVGAAGASGLRTMVGDLGAWLFSVAVLAGTLTLMNRPAFLRVSSLAAGGADRLRARGLAFWAERRKRAASAAVVRRSTTAAPAPAPVSAAEPRAPLALTPSAPPTPPTIENASGMTRVAAKKPLKPAATQTALPIEPGTRGYSLPPIDLLNEPQHQGIESEQELLHRAQQITEKLQEFSVGGSVVAVHPGPVVTTFEFKPDAGVKYSKITGMIDDLSLALKAESVRIDRMPGRSTVGIEVPNRRQETIYPRELIGSDRFRNSRSKLTLALGKDITGEVFTAELDRMPHLLIAGATGAGKSVGLNGMITSLLYKATPEDLRMIMIDTKMIELGIYADIPHLLVPVVTEPKKAAAALKWAVTEMEQRYRKLASVGVRNLAQFNELMAKEPGRTMPHPRTGEPLTLTHMPYIVIVIDEMADLMMVTTSEVEEAIMRLAQMARAVGIHLVLATQRPSVDVITGTIKANFPSRIAFRVSQRVDSRTIIDQQGAEHLLGRGDMLFLTSGASRVVRLHSGFITEPELNRITSYLKKMAEPIYDESVLSEEREGGGTVDDGERDEMYAEAVRTVIQEGKCSITLIQRRLQLGYARAARIVDIMEREGVVSPGEGSKPREILVGPEVLATLQPPRA